MPGLSAQQKLKNERGALVVNSNFVYSCRITHTICLRELFKVHLHVLLMKVTCVVHCVCRIILELSTQHYIDAVRWYNNVYHIGMWYDVCCRLLTAHRNSSKSTLTATCLVCHTQKYMTYVYTYRSFFIEDNTVFRVFFFVL